MTARRLHLMPAELPEPVSPPATTTRTSAETSIAEPISSEESSALRLMRLERDAALEELAFLREQLRSTEAYYAQRFEMVYERLGSEQRSFLEELTRLGSQAR